MYTLFISDLHLCGERPAITDLFLSFLERDAANAEALYILGDLFEFWVGDDAAGQVEFKPIVDALAALTERGVPLYVLHGNRDFLLGNRFEDDTGAQLLSDPCVINLYGERVLVMHGDSLCTRDTEYQSFRAMVRGRQWQRDFLAKSLDERNAVMSSYRQISKTATATKQAEIMDVTQSAVEDIMRQHAVSRLIHGHTHRPGEHQFTLDGQIAWRTVLGDWYTQGSVLRCSTQGCTLSELPLIAPALAASKHH